MDAQTCVALLAQARALVDAVYHDDRQLAEVEDLCDDAMTALRDAMTALGHDPDGVEVVGPKGEVVIPLSMNRTQMIAALAILDAFSFSLDELPTERNIEDLPYAPFAELTNKNDGDVEVWLRDVSGGAVLDAHPDEGCSFWIDEDGRPHDYVDGERVELALTPFERVDGMHRYRATLVEVRRDEQGLLMRRPGGK